MTSPAVVGAVLAGFGGMNAQAVEPSYEIAHVQRPTPLYSSPGGAVVARVGTRTEFGSPQTLGVVRHRGRWLAVVSTLRPNGKVSWVRSGAVRVTVTDVSLTLDRSRRLLLLKRGSTVVRRMTAVR